MAKKQEYIGWAIVGENDVLIYTSHHRMRKTVIADYIVHRYGSVVEMMSPEHTKRGWHMCQALGDRAVKVRITVIK
jgi:hypothetical protein